MADVTDIDCLSCGYEIRDFAQAASVMCGHGFIHYNCSYFNMECRDCDAKLTPGPEPVQLRPKIYETDENLKASLLEINESLKELKVVMKDQKDEQERTIKIVEELQAQLKAKDEKILSLQKEVYEMKLERVDFLKQELTDKLNSLKST